MEITNRTTHPLPQVVLTSWDRDLLDWSGLTRYRARFCNGQRYRARFGGRLFSSLKYSGKAKYSDE